MARMIDHHAHPFDREPTPLDLTRASIDLAEMGTGEGSRPPPLWRALLANRLARRLGVAPDDVADARADAARDYGSYVRALFADAGITQVLMDASWPAGAERHVGDYAALSGCPVHLLFRIEPLVDALVDEGRGPREIADKVDAALDQAHAGGYRGLKTVLAYRSGLAVDPEASEVAAAASLHADSPVARRGKALRDWILRRVLRFAADTRLPLQVHAGFGDSDLRLAAADPTLLEPVLDTPEGRAAPVVLLHAAYPFVDHAAYLATARPNVAVDVSLVNLFAPIRVADTLARLVGLAPPERILLGTDAYALPELFWFGATVHREAWSEVARRLGEAGVPEAWITATEHRLFEDNARRLYGLEGG